MNYCGRISKATVIRNLDDLKRRGQTGSFIAVSRTIHVTHDCGVDLPNERAYAMLDKAVAVMLKLPRRWQYSVSVASSFVSVFAIDARREDFTDWARKNQYAYTDKAEFIKWNDRPGGFWSHSMTVMINDVKIQAHYNE